MITALGSILMRKLALILISALSLSSSSAFAVSYQRTDGTIVDPMQSVYGGSHTYSGVDLEPGASLSGAYLSGADVPDADLNGATMISAELDYANLLNADLTEVMMFSVLLDYANLTGANLTDAGLPHADLVSADLTGATLTSVNLNSADLTGAVLAGADLSGANLQSATGLSSSTGAALYDSNTDFTDTGFDPVAAGWTLIPEPGTALLMGFGLAGLAGRRR